MPVMTQLDVVNDMLATLGELPINSIAESHPMVPAALRTLSVASAREQAKSWWFNKELADLIPDTLGNIYLPNDVLRVDPQSASLHYVQRGRRLYKPYEPSANDKYKFTQKVRCWLVRELLFEDLPVPAQTAISYAAQLDFMSDYDADQNKFANVTQAYRQAIMILNADHTKNSDINVLRRRGGVYGGVSEIGVERLRDGLNYYR